jgi:hypothetical protein
MATSAHRATPQAIISAAARRLLDLRAPLDDVG